MDLEKFHTYTKAKYDRRREGDVDRSEGSGERRSYRWIGEVDKQGNYIKDYLEDGSFGLRELKRELICAFKGHDVGFDYIFADTGDGNGKVVRRENGANFTKLKVRGYQFVKLLNSIFEEHGLEPIVTSDDVKQRRRTFQYNNVPPTPQVMKVLNTLKERAIPNLQIEDIVTTTEAWDWVLESN